MKNSQLSTLLSIRHFRLFNPSGPLKFVGLFLGHCFVAGRGHLGVHLPRASAAGLHDSRLSLRAHRPGVGQLQE